VGIEWRGPVPQSNYTVGRDGNAVELIVDHWTVVMSKAPYGASKTPPASSHAHYASSDRTGASHSRGETTRVSRRQGL